MIDLKNKTYIISGFARGTGQIHGSNSNFALRVDVSYYQGSGKADLVETHRFDYETDCTDWQFVSGSIKSKDGCLIIGNIDSQCKIAVRSVNLTGAFCKA